MQVITLKCPACASTLKVEDSQTLLKCEFCQNPVHIIKPLTSNSFVEGLSEIQQTKYTNYVSILEQSMLAGNYTEGYEYCNKGLEINPNSAELWANKAICSLWISTISQISEEKAMEIITYLNACKRNDPDSKIYNETAPAIAENLYFCALYKYTITQPNQYNNINGSVTYSLDAEKSIISSLKVMQLSFEIYPNYQYLIQVLRLINNCKIPLFNQNKQSSNIALRNGFDSLKVRDKVIKELRKDYTQEKLEDMAQNKYDDFTELSNEFYKVDRSLWRQMFSPLVTKYKPKAPELTPEELKKRRRNKFICVGICISIILLIAIFAVLNYVDKKKSDIEKQTPVVFSDSVIALKNQYDKEYLNSEFMKDDDKTLFAQKIIVVYDKFINDVRLKKVFEFYKDYYERIAKDKYKNRYVLQIWFYTEPQPKTFNPYNLTDSQIRKEKSLHGYIFYNYDTQKYTGSLSY